MASMKISRKGSMELIGHEAIAQTRYRDSRGTWTIGVGHTKKAGQPDPEAYLETMSVEDVLALFRKDVVAYADLVNSALTAKVTQTQFDALVSYCFNTGQSKTEMAQKLNFGDTASAIAAFNKLAAEAPKDVRERRTLDAKLFETGVYSRGQKGVIYPIGANFRPIWKQGQKIDLTPYFP